LGRPDRRPNTGNAERENRSDGRGFVQPGSRQPLSKNSEQLGKSSSAKERDALGGASGGESGKADEGNAVCDSEVKTESAEIQLNGAAKPQRPKAAAAKDGRFNAAGGAVANRAATGTR